MKTETFELKEGVVFKTYLWEKSDELQITKRPAILVLPGGAYVCCSDREAEPVALSYLAEGFNVFLLFYSARKGFNLPFEEAQEALKLIRVHAEEWAVDPNRIAVCGFSAGAHLAAALGTFAEEKPNAMVLGYPPVRISRMKEVWWVDECEGIVDIVDKVDENTVPAFITSSYEDLSVPIFNSIALMDKLEKCGVPFECHIFRSGPHGYSMAKKISCAAMPQMVNETLAKWFPMSVEWLKATIGDVEFQKV